VLVHPHSLRPLTGTQQGSSGWYRLNTALPWQSAQRAMNDTSRGLIGGALYQVSSVNVGPTVA
jgi:hypothetical protein